MDRDDTSGWFAYAPTSGAVFPPHASARASELDARAEAGSDACDGVPDEAPPTASRPDGPTPVRLMNEYSVSWPLWTAEGPADRDEIPVSPALAARLCRWAEHFDRHYHWETGWDDPARSAPHAAEAETLRGLLEAELGADYAVALELWEA